MGKYSVIKREFAFLETVYSFTTIMEQKHGAYYFILYTNQYTKIMVLYDDRINEKRESPVWIRIYDADCFGTAYDDVDEYNSEFHIQFGTSKDRIRCAAEWLKRAIENKTVSIKSSNE